VPLSHPGRRLRPNRRPPRPKHDDPTTHDTFFPSPPGRGTRLAPIPGDHLQLVHAAATAFTAIDCLSCHAHNNQATARARPAELAEFNYDSASWLLVPPPRDGGGVLPPGITNDSARDVSVDALIPSYVDTSISGLSPQTEMLPHAHGPRVETRDAAAFASCGNCMSTRAQGRITQAISIRPWTTSAWRNRRRAGIATPVRSRWLRRPDRQQSRRGHLPPVR